MRASREAVTITRPVQVECVPDGTPYELPVGTVAHITQALGSNFTLLVGGQLVRLKGADADAIGREVPVVPGSDGDPEDLPARIQQVLKTCYDPEIPVDIVELGLIYGCDITPMEEGADMRVNIDLTVTAPGCGMGESLANEVADKLLALDGIGEVNVQIVLDPPWDRSRMSEAAQLALGL